MIVIKVLNHPGHGNSKLFYRRHLDVFQFLEDVSPLIQEGSAVLTNWGGAAGF